MELGCLGCMVRCVVLVSLSGMRVVRCGLVVSGFMLLRCFAMMLGGVLVMLCGFVMVLCGLLGHKASGCPA
jgi:hypothetical protein